MSGSFHFGLGHHFIPSANPRWFSCEHWGESYLEGNVISWSCPGYQRLVGETWLNQEPVMVTMARRKTLETKETMTTEYLRQTIADVTASRGRAREEFETLSKSLEQRVIDHETTLDILQELLAAAEAREREAP